jgi:anthranilate synthase
VDTTTLTTGAGFAITRTAAAFDPAELERIAALVDRRRGGVLSSGMEYPGRYTRWHLAYVNPPIEITARGRRITARALNQRGSVIFPVIADAMLRTGVEVAKKDNSKKREAPERTELSEFPEISELPELTVYVAEGEEAFTEEERSRQPTVFSALREIVAAFGCDDPHLGLYGAFGYDLSFQFEPVRLKQDRSDGQRDLVLHLPDEIYVVDLRREEAVKYSYEFTIDGAGTAGLERATADTPESKRGTVHETDFELPVPGRYAAIVERAKERFRCGDLFEVVPSHLFHARCASPSAFYERLRLRNPAPFEFLFNLGPGGGRAGETGAGEYLVGASPEMYVRVQGDRVETCPISGTIARGADPLEDAANIALLLGSAKEESELTMCTDVDRNDKSRVCVPGTVTVIGRRQIEMYSRLIHTVDHIEGRLKPGFDAIDAFLTHMWAVTVTGAPKAWAMQFIEDNETAPRRWYGGAVGKIGFDGSMNTGLTLRTARISGGVAAVRAGATLLYDSDPES